MPGVRLLYERRYASRGSWFFFSAYMIRRRIFLASEPLYLLLAEPGPPCLRLGVTFSLLSLSDWPLLDSGDSGDAGELKADLSSDWAIVS
jgi:hypothetical protein